MTPVDKQELADCFRICRNFQERGAEVVWAKLQEHFPEKTPEEIVKLIIELEQISSNSSKPAGV